MHYDRDGRQGKKEAYVKHTHTSEPRVFWSHARTHARVGRQTNIHVCEVTEPIGHTVRLCPPALQQTKPSLRTVPGLGEVECAMRRHVRG